MNIDMTKTLRELRKQKNVTQEQLANFLGITPQSVGKWERGGYPDITLLPKIALYFNVTVDTLLGVDEARIKEAIEGYEKESKRLSNIGDVEVELKLWEKAYEECLTALDNMKKHAIIADTQPDFKHTSFTVNKTYYKHSDTSKNYTENQCGLCLKWLSEKVFDPVRNDKRFLRITDELKQYAN